MHAVWRPWCSIHLQCVNRHRLSAAAGVCISDYVNPRLCLTSCDLVQALLLFLQPVQLPGWQTRSGMQSWRMMHAQTDWQQVSSGSLEPPYSPLPLPSGRSRSPFGPSIQLCISQHL